MVPKSLRKRFAETALSLAESDSSVVVLVGDISHGLFSEYRAKFPDRYFNVGILEPAMASIAAGLSMVGLKPIVHTIAPFLIERSFEQLKLDFSYQGLSAMFISVGGAFDYSNLGCTHHSYIDTAMVASLDDSTVISPVSETELESLMVQSHAKWRGLTYIKLTENGLGDYSSDGSIRLGVPVLRSVGDGQVAVISVGPTFVQVEEALSDLALQKRPTHIHIHTIKPIDFKTLDSLLGDSTKVLVVEQSMSTSGIAGNIALSTDLTKPRQVISLGLSGFVRGYGTYSELLEESGLDSVSIANKLRALMVAAQD